jgi:hypothetical protein
MTYQIPGGAGTRRPSALALLAALVLFLTSSLGAQEPADLRGQVLRYGEPVSGIPVTLHRVTSEGSGEVAFTQSDADGGFRFPIDRVEGASFTVFFVTAEFQSVRYFGPPLHPDQPREGYAVQVFDTARELPVAPRIVRRDVVLIPEAGGSWEVNEIVTVSNSTDLALVAETGRPTWEFRVPGDATDFQAGEGDILPHEISFMGDRVMVLTPLIPGQRDLFIRYRIPGTRSGSTVPIGEATDTFNLYVRQPSHLTSVTGLETTRMIEAEGERFLQYGGTDLPAGALVSLQWARTAPPVDPVVAAVSVTVLLLVAGVAVAWRQRSRYPSA